jgi:hypothetical protein
MGASLSKAGTAAAPAGAACVVAAGARTFDLAELGGGDRKNRHRIAHSMKSNSRLMGGHDLSKRLAALEARLETADGADVNTDDLTLIERDYELIGGPLRDFVGPS